MRFWKLGMAAVFGVGMMAGCSGGSGSVLDTDLNQGQILFLAEGNGQPAIRIVDGDGDNGQTLFPGVFSQADISPDRQRVVFTGPPALYTLETDIFLGDVKGSPPRKIVSGGRGAKFSPDGQSIVYTYRTDLGDGTPGADIYRLKLDGSKPIRLTTSKDAESSPTFSPDGRTVAYVARRGTESKIELMDADGKNSRRLTKTAGEEFEPCFSPDGAAIAFDSSKSGLSSDIYQVDLTSGAETRLTSDSGDERVPLYSPNGTEIAYTTVINKGTFVMNRDGSNPVKLIPNGYATSWK
ncbi:MAG TPA: hypothetical protein VF681_14900 [Abditibacteriaceae bacterium]|jgi:TolB protein